jgi:hypothetical protein
LRWAGLNADPHEQHGALGEQHTDDAEGVNENTAGHQEGGGAVGGDRRQFVPAVLEPCDRGDEVAGDELALRREVVGGVVG